MKTILIILIPLFIFVSHGMAQDIATEHTQILNNVELVVNAERQLQSLLNQAQMIENQIEELKSVATYPNAWGNVDLQRSQLFSLVSQGITIASQIQTQLTQMQQQAQNILSSGSLSDQQAATVQASMNVIQITLGRINASRQTYQTQENAMQDLLAKNNSSVGQTQALQTLNQIQAQNVTQMQATQEALNNIATLQATKMTQENQDKQAEKTVIDKEIHPIVNGTSSFDFGSS